MLANKEHTPSDSTCEHDADNDVIIIKLPSINVEASHQNVDVEAEDDCHCGASDPDSLSVRLASMKLQGSTDDNVRETAQELLNVECKDTVGVAVCNEARLQNGHVQTDSEALNCINCGPADPLDVVTLVCATPQTNDNDDDDSGQLKSTGNEDRHQNDAEGVEDEHESENIEQRLAAVVLDNDDVDDKSKEVPNTDHQGSVDGIIDRGPGNGDSTRRQDGNQPSKWRRLSPPSNGVGISTVDQIIDVSQPVLTDLEHPLNHYSTALGHGGNIAGSVMIDYHSVSSQYNRSIPGSSMRHDCRFANGPDYRNVISQSLYVPNHCLSQGCYFPPQSLPFCDVTAGQSSTFHPGLYRPIVAPPTSITIPSPMTPDKLPELTPDDVTNTLGDSRSDGFSDVDLVSMKQDLMWDIATMEPVQQQPATGTCRRSVDIIRCTQTSGFGTSPERMSNVNLDVAATPVVRVRSPISQNFVEQQPTCNAVPPFVMTEYLVDSPSPHEQVVDHSSASSPAYRLPMAQISPASDTSQYASSVSSYGQPSSVAAASSCGDNSDVLNSKRSSSGSVGGSPAFTTDGRDSSREPSPRNSATYHISTPINQLYLDDGSIDSISQFIHVCDMNQEEVSLNPVSSVGDEEQSKAAKRASQLNQSDLLFQNGDGDTVLHSALIDDDPSYTEALIQRFQQLGLLSRVISMRNHLQQTPLCLAVITNQPAFVERLLRLGSDVNVQIVTDSVAQMPSKREQPLHFAARHGHRWLITLQVLLQSPHIDIDAFNSDGRSALHCAVESHRKGTQTEPIDTRDTIRLLVESGANLNKPDGQSDKTPLHYAIEKRDVELVRLLLELAATPTAVAAANKASGSRCASLEAAMLSTRTGTGNAALHLAVSVRHMGPVDKRRLVQLLLSRGADPSARNGESQLPREMTNDSEIVGLLRGRGGHGR